MTHVDSIRLRSSGTYLFGIDFPPFASCCFWCGVRRGAQRPAMSVLVPRMVGCLRPTKE
ncbi:hypothetical protein HMPREF0281_02281 [Corynebacterium ammoniagenes DSM 20306]|uniref:Uncharacterized protein n=1 Tax=Corynebacterium ammoniagenes DSM 20306 TaxID=649754 RepID=A0ABN0ABT1_CORAM|nr:hypothetical protein HMPREF0281_02281 [Corynebacterium ammoniagenes DSM 20306]